MVKIRISYETPGELLQVTRCLQHMIESIKYTETGKYKKAYIKLKQGRK